jgi:hypothetical protein
VHFLPAIGVAGVATDLVWRECCSELIIQQQELMMRHSRSGSFLLFFSLLVTPVHAEIKANNDNPLGFPAREDVRPPIVNFFGVIYTISSTAIRQTRKLSYQTRDEFDQLIYDIRKYDIENRVDK